MYRYSMVDINVISNYTIVINCFIIFNELLATGIAIIFLIKKTREDVSDSTVDVN